jgi:hypothetical protein
MRPTPHAIFTALLLVQVAAVSGAGELHGNVSQGRSPEQLHARSHDTVIWIEQVSEKTERQLTHVPYHWFWKHREPPPPLRQLVQSGGCYRPHVVVIPAGSQLVIHNLDSLWHGPFSVSPARGFDLGKLAPGRADTLSFDSTGVVAVRCDIHPSMSAFVVVTPNHAFTQPDSSGEWRLPELPAGHYVVHVWKPDRGDSRHEVDLPAHGSVSLPVHW